MDADDIAFPRRLEKQMRYLDAHPEIDLLSCRAWHSVTMVEVIGLLPFAASHEDICAHPWRGFPLPHPTWLGRAEWFRRFRYAKPEVKRAEDQELLLRSFSSSRFACLNEVMLGYRQGKFDLAKTLIARRHLLVAQEGHFIGRRQWTYACMAFVATITKTGVDILAAIPGCENLFFSRMSGKVPASVVDEFERARRGASLP